MKLCIGLLLAGLVLPACAQTVHYEPTLESLNQHPLPAWYADAKLGIFVHWGLYSVPGWAPLQHPDHDFRNVDYIKNNPYAEWYYNVMRIDGSPTQAYHREHYGADYNYYNFAAVFDQRNIGVHHHVGSAGLALDQITARAMVVVGMTDQENFYVFKTKAKLLN